MCFKVGRHTFSENSIISHGSQELKGKFLSQEGCLGSGETNKIQQRKGCRIFCLTFRQDEHKILTYTLKFAVCLQMACLF